MVNFLSEHTETDNGEDEPPSMDLEDGISSGNVTYLEDYVRRASLELKPEYHSMVKSPNTMELFLGMMTSMTEGYLTEMIGGSNTDVYYNPVYGIAGYNLETTEKKFIEASTGKDVVDYTVNYSISSSTLTDNVMDFALEDGDDCTRIAGLFFIK